MRIVGMNIEQYVGQGCKESEDTYGYEYFSEDKERHVLYGIQSNGQKIKMVQDFILMKKIIMIMLIVIVIKNQISQKIQINKWRTIKKVKL